ncbi:type VI secretion system accessory protein TagJ [Gemmata sp.]|uniref:type VI secretion system accessory protein TagJ n=1 Tax=Gemmata sp. TaxID=1914242 RepID=UPI003F723792
MTVHDALAEGRLTDAVAVQEAAVAAAPGDPAARRLLVDLLAFAGRLDDAASHLAEVRSDAPEWPEAERELHRLLRAERRRSEECRQPQIRPEPAPKHASRRWLAMKALRKARPEDAVRCVDAADAVAPELRGFLDGQEFVGLRDADDRFASVLEAFVGGEYVWFAWEALRKVALAPAAVLLDQLYRPATITLADGTAIEAHLPLVYPRSHAADDAFALGTETDHICPDHGPTRCVGGKLLLVGDEDEVPLAECRMIEVRTGFAAGRLGL